MTKRDEKAKKILDQEAPSVDDVLTEMMRSGVGALDEMLQDPETIPRLKIAIVKATAFLQRYRAQASQATGKDADIDALRAEIHSQVVQELTYREMTKALNTEVKADMAKIRGVEEELDAAAEAESENSEQPEDEAG